jgi:hypothetical protein
MCLQVEAMMVGRQRTTFMPASDASRTLSAAFSLHNRRTSYSPKSSAMFAKETLRGGGDQMIDAVESTTLDRAFDDDELDQVCQCDIEQHEALCLRH